MAVHYLGDNGPDGMCAGTSATELVAFHGSTPVAQASAIASPGSSLASVKTIVISILTALRNKGLIAS